MGQRVLCWEYSHWVEAGDGGEAEGKKRVARTLLGELEEHLQS